MSEGGGFLAHIQECRECGGAVMCLFGDAPPVSCEEHGGRKSGQDEAEEE